MIKIFSAGRTNGTDGPTEGSTRGPRGPKKWHSFFELSNRPLIAFWNTCWVFFFRWGLFWVLFLALKKTLKILRNLTPQAHFVLQLDNSGTKVARVTYKGILLTSHLTSFWTARAMFSHLTEWHLWHLVVKKSERKGRRDQSQLFDLACWGPNHLFLNWQLWKTKWPLMSEET